MAKIALVVLMCGLLPLIQGSTQSVGVRGQLKCGNKALAKTVVKLVDKDTLGRDDVLGCVHTDAEGNFEVHGSENEITPLDPVLKIYTDCNDQMLWGAADKPCERKIAMEVPKSYINQGGEVTRWFEAGLINLELKQDGEERKCDIFDICDGVFGK